MILTVPVPNAPSTVIVALHQRRLSPGSMGQRAQRPKPLQATGLQPDPAERDPGVARHALEVRERVGSVDIGDAQTRDVDGDRGGAAGEEQLRRLEHVAACPAAQRPSAFERRRSESQLQERGHNLDITSTLHAHDLRRRGAGGGRGTQGGSGATPAV